MKGQTRLLGEQAVPGPSPQMGLRLRIRQKCAERHLK